MQLASSWVFFSLVFLLIVLEPRQIRSLLYGWFFHHRKEWTLNVQCNNEKQLKSYGSITCQVVESLFWYSSIAYFRIFYFYIFIKLSFPFSINFSNPLIFTTPFSATPKIHVKILKISLDVPLETYEAISDCRNETKERYCIQKYSLALKVTLVISTFLKLARRNV